MLRKTYRTKRLSIRPYTARDYAAWEHAYKTILPRQSKFDWIPEGLAINRREFKKVVARHNLKAREDKVYVWALFERKGGALVGLIDVGINSRHEVQVANLGYRIINRHWRKGYAKEALKQLIPAALRDLKLNRLEAVIDLDNRPSIALVKAVEMKKECVRRKYYFQDGAWADQVVFTAIRADLKLPLLRT